MYEVYRVYEVYGVYKVYDLFSRRFIQSFLKLFLTDEKRKMVVYIGDACAKKSRQGRLKSFE